jgi:iron complex outermembrane receptor protein
MKNLLQVILLFGFLTTRSSSYGQSEQTIQGTVTDVETHEPLPGVNVVIKGTTQGVVSDVDGKFSLTAKVLPITLVFSASGFRTQEVEVADASEELPIQLTAGSHIGAVTVTARRRTETVQDIPIPVSVLHAELIEDAGAFNVNRVKEIIPSVQLYTSNPRNTGINIRGIGSPFGLTNDGLDPGVGFYVDGIYYARPAVATLDFIDVEQIEVLRGPQGTLFGKNTTAGAFNITTRKPSFDQSATFEVSYGNYGFVQAKSSITGPLCKTLAARVSFSGTQRNGLIENVNTGKFTNDINNLGFRGQVLYKPSDKVSFLLAGENSRQRPDGYAQVVAGVVQTERPAYRQFSAIIADLNYALPSTNAFDRKIDHDTPWNSGNDLGGASLNADFKIGAGTLTSTTAWRYWNWDPSNDRDFTGLQALAKSQNPAEHKNWSQEIRYAGNITSKVSGVVGLFFIDQAVNIHGTEESGNAQWRFSQSSTSTLWTTPGLFDGFGIRTESSIKSKSAAVFANLDWEVLTGLHLQPGVRYNYDKKVVRYDRTTYGGLDTATYAGTKAEKTTLQGFKNEVYSNQSYGADANENNLTYLFTLAYKASKRINGYATYSTSYKPVGVNVAGLPTVNGFPATDLAVIKPEHVKHLEVGVKTTPADNFTLNLTYFNTKIENYQTNVQSPELGVNRGYIANAQEVSVRGTELDANLKLNKNLSFYSAVTYNDGKYVKFTNAPLPLEETGHTIVNDQGQTVQQAFKDVSGGRLPGISKVSGSFGGEFLSNSVQFFGESKFFLGFDSFYRSDFSSSPSPSKYLNIDGYFLLNGRFGVRAATGLSVFVWGRNLLDKDYYEQLLVAGGNAGHYAGVLGDPRMYGITMRYNF